MWSMICKLHSQSQEMLYGYTFTYMMLLCTKIMWVHKRYEYTTHIIRGVEIENLKIIKRKCNGLGAIHIATHTHIQILCRKVENIKSKLVKFEYHLLA